ncbi:uncharacterized protein LOC132215502 [Myotis daubentonii]|uniref:uncharacterized protein LOC132215502 n=1 Tax=Myotis daubentonii TaxID=98922 RepID=UPI0028734EF1|nr:uncharacterized protein LOC132215502 [Myotis daubentonii]
MSLVDLLSVGRNAGARALGWPVFLCPAPCPRALGLCLLPAHPGHSKLHGNPGRETWHPARGAWGVGTLAPVPATVHRIQRFLLDEGAGAASVELAARRGLAVPRRQGEAVGIALLLDQAQRALPAPGAGGQELPTAGRVLHQAQQTREGTARAQGRAQGVQGVLAEAGAHTRAAEQGLQAARRTLGGPEASVQKVAGRLAQMILAADVTPDPGLLSSAAVALRTRVALCQQQAQEAEEQAAHALGLAGGLGKVRREQWTLGSGGSGLALLQELQAARAGVVELQEGRRSRLATVRDAAERVQRTRRGPGAAESRAERETRASAPGSGDPSPGLERRLVQNEQTLGKRVATLWALGRRAAALLGHLRLPATAHATC